MYTLLSHLLSLSQPTPQDIHMVGFLTAVNCWNVKWATRIQDVATVTKVDNFSLSEKVVPVAQIAALLLVVGAGLIFLGVSPSPHSAIAPDQLMQVCHQI